MDSERGCQRSHGRWVSRTDQEKPRGGEVGDQCGERTQQRLVILDPVETPNAADDEIASEAKLGAQTLAIASGRIEPLKVEPMADDLDLRRAHPVVADQRVPHLGTGGDDAGGKLPWPTSGPRPSGRVLQSVESHGNGERS